MKLYYSKSACSFAVRIIINELGLTCEYESVNLKIKQTVTGSDYFTINPKGAVPALITDDGETMTEVAVILQYLADTSHATHLFPPPSDFKHYRVLEWLNYVASEMHKSIGQLFHPDLSQEIKQNLVIPLVMTKLKFVDNHLHRHKYLMGDHFTLPDAYLFVMLRWALFFKFDLAEWPHIYRYFAEIHNRASVQLSLKEEEG